MLCSWDESGTMIETCLLPETVPGGLGFFQISYQNGSAQIWAGGNSEPFDAADYMASHVSAPASAAPKAGLGDSYKDSKRLTISYVLPFLPSRFYKIKDK